MTPAWDAAGYRRLVEQVPAVVVVFALDRDLAPVYVSPQWAAILGVPVADWFERTDEVMARRIHPRRSRAGADEARRAGAQCRPPANLRGAGPTAASSGCATSAAS